MFAELKNVLINISHYLPFVSVAVVNNEINVSAIISRLIEYAIIAGFLMYTNIQVINTKLEYFSHELERARIDQKELVLEIKELQKNMFRLKKNE